MTGRGSLKIVTIAAIGLTAIVWTGCARGTAPGSGGPAGAGAGQGGGVGAGLAAGGTGSSGSLGAGGSASADASVAALPGGAGAGVTLPSLPNPQSFVESADLKDIHFDFDRYGVRPQDGSVLAANARWLKANGRASVLIEGHADERGTNEYNLALGERRAKATRDQLVALGVAPVRITIITYGEERPVCTKRSDACWAQNRRAHFLVRLPQ